MPTRIRLRQKTISITMACMICREVDPKILYRSEVRERVLYAIKSNKSPNKLLRFALHSQLMEKPFKVPPTKDEEEFGINRPQKGGRLIAQDVEYRYKCRKFVPVLVRMPPHDPASIFPMWQGYVVTTEWALENYDPIGEADILSAPGIICTPVGDKGESAMEIGVAYKTFTGAMKRFIKEAKKFALMKAKEQHKLDEEEAARKAKYATGPDYTTPYKSGGGRYAGMHGGYPDNEEFMM